MHLKNDITSAQTRSVPSELMKKPPNSIGSAKIRYQHLFHAASAIPFFLRHVFTSPICTDASPLFARHFQLGRKSATAAMSIAFGRSVPVDANCRNCSILQFNQFLARLVNQR